MAQNPTAQKVHSKEGNKKSIVRKEVRKALGKKAVRKAVLRKVW